MDINETSMFKVLRTLIQPDEKILCPVFAMIQKDVKRMTNATSEFAYITVTNKGRLVLYRFDNASSRPEIFMLTHLMFGETQQMKNTGIYSAELSFLDDNGMTQDLTFTIEPKPKGRTDDFPQQQKYADKMLSIFDKLIT